MALSFQYDNNIIVANSSFNFAVDPLKFGETCDINFVTHAHRDHINMTKKSKEKSFVMTPLSADVVKGYFGEFNHDGIEFGQKLKIDDLIFEFKNSGHVAGSYFMNIYGDGNKTTITGDVNTQDTVITKAIESEETDTLIIESTFGQEHYSFPDRNESYDELVKWLKHELFNNKLPVIFAYVFGKTQEITALINRELPVNIGLVETAKTNNDICNKHGLNIQNYFKLNGNLKEMDVLIIPPTKINQEVIHALEYGSKKKLSFASVTGHDFSFGKKFKISSHSDCAGLLNHIEQCNPKQVYTYHGHAEDLAKLVEKKLKIKASPLKHFSV